MAKFCAHCGKPLDPGVKFCPGCGKPVEDAANPAQPKPAQSVGNPIQTVQAIMDKEGYSGKVLANLVLTEMQALHDSADAHNVKL